MRLLVGEAVLDDVKVIDAIGRLALAHLAARAADLALELHGRQLHVELDLVVVAEVVVDVARGDLARVDGADDGGRAALAVAAGEQALLAHDGAVGVGDDAAPLGGDALLLEGGGVDVLADGHDHAVARDHDVAAVRRARRGTAALEPADDLRLHLEAGDVAVLVHDDLLGRVQVHDLAALGLGAGDLLVLRRHVGDAATVGDDDLLGAQAHGGAGHVHGHVAAADHGDREAGEVGRVVVAHVAQELDGGHDALGVLARKAQLLVRVRTDGEVDCVVLLAQAGELVAVDAVVQLGLDAAVEQPLDLRVELLARQAVVGDAVAQHAAEVLALLEDLDAVAHEGQVVRAREARRAAADDGDALLGGGLDDGLVVARVLHGVALEAADVHRVVHHAAAAVHLAGVLADEAADQRQRVVLADEAHGLGVAAGLDERDVAGDVHAGRAAGDARHGLVLREAARVLLHVVLEVVAEAADGHEGHLAGLVADRAVARQVHRAGGGLDEVERLHRGAVVQDVVEQVAQHAQAVPARRALAAALRRAHGHVRGRELDGARSERAHREALLEHLVHARHDRLGLALLHDVHSCHRPSPCTSGVYCVPRPPRPRHSHLRLSDTFPECVGYSARRTWGRRAVCESVPAGDN